MKYESSSDVSVSNSARSSAPVIKKTINWRDYFNPKELKKIEEIEEEQSEVGASDSDAASDS